MRHRQQRFPVVLIGDLILQHQLVGRIRHRLYVVGNFDHRPVQDHAAGIGVGGGYLVLACFGKLLFNALVLSPLSLLFFQLFADGLLSCFIQVTGIEFVDIRLDPGVDVLQLPVDLFWL